MSEYSIEAAKLKEEERQRMQAAQIAEQMAHASLAIIDPFPHVELDMPSEPYGASKFAAEHIQGVDYGPAEARVAAHGLAHVGGIAAAVAISQMLPAITGNWELGFRRFEPAPKRFEPSTKPRWQTHTPGAKAATRASKAHRIKGAR